MNLQFYSAKQTNHLHEVSQIWMQEIAAYFLNDFEDKIKQSGMDLLKLFLLYAVSGISFRVFYLR